LLGNITGLFWFQKPVAVVKRCASSRKKGYAFFAIMVILQRPLQYGGVRGLLDITAVAGVIIPVGFDEEETAVTAAYKSRQLARGGRRAVASRAYKVQGATVT
jgi:hypothetical protein